MNESGRTVPLSMTPPPGTAASVLPLRGPMTERKPEMPPRISRDGPFRALASHGLRAPQTIEDCAIPQTFLVELLGKTIYQQGSGRLTDLVAALCLPGTVIEALCRFMRQEGMLEIGRRGHNDADVEFDLTAAGRKRAADWLARSHYVGPAPVSLDAYGERVRAQSVHHHRLTQREVYAAFADLVVPRDVLDRVGTALNGGKPLMLHGEPGSGKTWLASQIRRLVTGTVAIPHAVYVHGEVVRIFDQHWHTPALFPSELPGSGIDNRLRADARWVQCERPCVSAGGELTLEMLDLSFDARAGFYEAPPHVKANNGLFIVDDLGRQIVQPTQLMNRWIVPMEHRVDHLMLRNGGKFELPFDLVLLFSSNLQPADLADAAFLRRVGHKIHIRALPFDDYLTLFARACTARDIVFDPTALADGLRALHRRDGRAFLACYPEDLATLAADRAAFLEQPVVLSAELLDWTWRCYFDALDDRPILQPTRPEACGESE